MNTLREAAEQALVALEAVTTEMMAVRDELAERGGRPKTNTFHQRLWDSSHSAYQDKAIPAAEALRAALAEQEQLSDSASRPETPTMQQVIEFTRSGVYAFITGHQEYTFTDERLYKFVLGVVKKFAPQSNNQSLKEDAEFDKVLGERDEYHDMADDLAYAIAAYFGYDIGEHTSENCPWLEALEAIETAPNPKPSLTHPIMSHNMRDFIEGMSVSVDVSTCERDSHHRYFGTVTEVMDCECDKHGVTLLVQDAEPNFVVESVMEKVENQEQSTDEQDVTHIAFEVWWQRHGQFCRAGGGEYEKTFAWRAWEAALEIPEPTSKQLTTNELTEVLLKSDIDARLSHLKAARVAIKAYESKNGIVGELV